MLTAATITALGHAAGGAPVYIVGGYVRDRLLGRASPDLDIAVAGDSAAVARRLAGGLGGAVFPLGAEHGVFRVTLRRPIDQIHHIDVAALRGTIEADLALRDFAINAIAWQPGAATLIDPHDGAGDCQDGRIRLVRDDAIQSDPVRALRAVRFAAELGFQIDERTAAITRRDAPLLARTAGERCRDELSRVLDTPVAAAMLRLADDLGLLDVLIPELMPSKGCTQPKEHYYDVFDHQIATVAVLDGILSPPSGDTIEAARFNDLWQELPGADVLQQRYTEEVAEGRPYRALLKFTGLLHDVSKPETRARQANGRIRFFGHDELGAVKAAAILERLRYTTREVRLVAALIKDHLRPGQLAAAGAVPTRRALYRFFRDLDDAAPDLLLLNLADHAAARGPAMTAEAWAGHAAYIRWILAQRARDETLVRPVRLITGHDLITELGLPPGPLLGRLLEAVREAQAVGRVTTRDQALRLARRLAARQPPPESERATGTTGPLGDAPGGRPR